MDRRDWQAILHGISKSQKLQATDHACTKYMDLYINIFKMLYSKSKCYIYQISRSVVSDSLLPMNRSMPGLPVHHQLPEFTQTHVH